ncbi:virulence factor TspB C-terminal domain-related protein [Acinetobacter sp. HZNU-JH01]|uniref:virulence factor TspB C-terminal domain-related protein n=1 Tax=Acinetobacter sp. HZNU-JH01 TaxID=3136280 RepID=UPI0030F3E75A
MRFFKYLVFIFLSFVSVDIFANYSAIYNQKKYVASSPEAICKLVEPVYSRQDRLPLKFNPVVSTTSAGYCYDTWNNSFTVFIEQTKCPPADYPSYLFINAGDPIPKQRCSQNSDGTFCKRTTKDNPMILNHENNRQSVLMFNVSETPLQSCTNLDDNQCDKTDPYGACFQPPDDGCTRQKDGSIICPDDTPPPQPDNTCNDATYCKRPPEGCGEGYVSGSFNGELLCVKSGPSNPPKPDDPTDPDNCKNGGSYCEAPPDDQSCPNGYYETTFNGSKICVKNSPDPNQPNPNDPNNNDPNDPNNPPDPNNPSQPGEGFDDSGIINAIKALRDSLLGAIGGVSGKLTTLINGQKQTNEHLDDIKKESIKSNEKLDKVNQNLTDTNTKLDSANDHLKNISDYSRAASEAIGETNKKLDSVKDSLDSQTKCENKDYNPNDKNSQKYVNCTVDQLNDLTGIGNSELPTRQLDERSFLTNLILVNAAYCPQDKQINWQTPFGTINRSVSFQDVCEQSAWFGYIVLALAYLYAAHIVVRS